jgi:hypothetical protein
LLKVLKEKSYDAMMLEIREDSYAATVPVYSLYIKAGCYAPVNPVYCRSFYQGSKGYPLMEDGVLIHYN